MCAHLRQKGLPVTEFIQNHSGKVITVIKDDEGKDQSYHLQRFVEGKNYDLNTAPAWLMKESARMLGRIHTALEDYQPLPVGIGEGFFQYMTPERAKESYLNTIKIAQAAGDSMIVDELEYRIGQMEKFSAWHIDIQCYTRKNTHGDYFISQLICGEHQINAVIDWTTACIHPVVWEIIRSFVYDAESCKEGEIQIPEFLDYVAEYLEYAKLTQYDVIHMPQLFYYQIAVCDYYNQYYQSTAVKRDIYLHQARFSTKLMKWFEVYYEELEEALRDFVVRRRLE